MSKTKPSANDAQEPSASHERTMTRIRDGLERLGDLPIFSTSINKIRRISSDPDADAMAVAKEVLKDANLSTKMLRLGNSAYYNRGVGKISVVSRAVIMLGFETIRNLTLTLKLIESFKNANTSVDMSSMLVKSYLAAGFVRDIAEKCGIKDIEESYVCALLHNLGEITVAYVLPDEYQRIKQLVEEGKSQSAAENAVLGTSIALISQDLAASWEFPSTVVNTMAPPPEGTKGRSTDKVSFNRSIAALSHQLLENLYNDSGDGEKLTATLENISETTGLQDSMVENYFSESFRQSCALASEYGLDKKLLKPPLGSAEGNIRNKWARQFSYYASKDDEAAANATETESSSEVEPSLPNAESVPAVAPNSPAVSTGASAVPAGKPALANTSSSIDPTTHSHSAGKPSVMTNSESPVAKANDGKEAPSTDGGASQGNHQVQLQVIQEITELIAKSARLGEVFGKVLEGLHRGAGFDRVLLCLVTPDRRHYVARLGLGPQREALKEYFSFPINPSTDIFSRILSEGGELTVSDVTSSEWGNLLPPDFVKVTNASSFIAAALRFQEKAVGFFYADCAVSGRTIGEIEQRNMLQFVTQARLALRLCS